MMAENKINSSDILVPLSPEKVEGLKKPLSGETGTVSWDFYTGFNAGVDATVQAIGVQNNLVELEVEKLAVIWLKIVKMIFLLEMPTMPIIAK
jgi:hypothetical protein